MIKPNWKLRIYLSEPFLALLITIFVLEIWGIEKIGKGIVDSYTVLLGLLLGGVTINFGLYGFFFHKTISFLGRVLRKAGYYEIFNYGFLSPIVIYIICIILVYFSGQNLKLMTLHKFTFFFLVYSTVSLIISIQNISGFSRICMDLEAEIEKMN